MRAAIYISVILGLVFFTIGNVGYLIDLSNYKLYVILAVSLFLVAALLHLIQQHHYNKRKETILQSYTKKKGIDKDSPPEKKDKTTYPAFRNKKRGLTWGGGNIHGSTAKRGSKTGFLKH